MILLFSPLFWYNKQRHVIFCLMDALTTPGGSNSRNMKTTDNKDKRDPRHREYPELHVGFPERNDASNPNEEMERVHVDIKTLDISRKNAEEVQRENAEEAPARSKREKKTKNV